VVPVVSFRFVLVLPVISPPEHARLWAVAVVSFLQELEVVGGLDELEKELARISREAGQEAQVHGNVGCYGILVHLHFFFTSASTLCSPNKSTPTI
jgi:hypothetical protein